jgi:hypothetical protein
LTGAIANLAPSALGLVYGNYLNSLQETSTAGTTSELSHLLAIAVCFGYISSAFCFAMSAQQSPPDQLKPLNEKDVQSGLTTDSKMNRVKAKRI